VGRVGLSPSASKALSPNLRLNFSPSPVARQLGQELAEGSVYQAGHAEGLTVGSGGREIGGMTERARTADGLTRLNTAFADMGKAGINMSFDDFDQAVGRAMRNEDVGENDFISRAAREMRSSIVDPFFEDGKAVGLYDDGDKAAFAPSYFPRQYRTKALIAKEPEIKAQWIDYMRGHIQARYARLRRIFATRSPTSISQIAQAPDDLKAKPAMKASAIRLFATSSIIGKSSTWAKASTRSKPRLLPTSATWRG
jgi:hypothetical protein